MSDMTSITQLGAGYIEGNVFSLQLVVLVAVEEWSVSMCGASQSVTNTPLCGSLGPQPLLSQGIVGAYLHGLPSCCVLYHNIYWGKYLHPSPLASTIYSKVLPWSKCRIPGIPSCKNILISTCTILSAVWSGISIASIHLVKYWPIGTLVIHRCWWWHWKFWLLT